MTELQEPLSKRGRRTRMSTISVKKSTGKVLPMESTVRRKRGEVKSYERRARQA